ncbi:MAG: hypothetical protein ACT4PU_04625 [Planctomycetota bacterium]
MIRHRLGASESHGGESLRKQDSANVFAKGDVDRHVQPGRTESRCVYHDTVIRCTKQPVNRLQRTTPRCAALWILLVLGCGSEAEPTSPVEPWPLQLSTSGVLGYAYLSSSSPLQAELYEAVFGADPASVEPTQPLVLALLDQSVLGGPLGLAIPIADEDSFLSALHGLPRVTDLDAQRIVLNFAGDSPLGTLLGWLSAREAGQGLLGSLLSGGGSAFGGGEEPVSLRLTIVTSLLRDHALLVPTFEAAAVMRDVVAELGAEVVGPPPDCVISLDTARLRVALAAELETAAAQLEALLTGRPGGGLLGTALSGVHGLARMDLGINGEFLWELALMLDPRQIDALQIQLRGTDVLRLNESGEAIPAGAVSLRWLLDPRAPLASVMEALQPLPPTPEGQWLLAFDAAKLAEALPRWLEPLSRAIHGDQRANSEWLLTLAQQLKAAGGLMSIGVNDDGLPTVLLARDPGESATGGLATWGRLAVPVLQMATQGEPSTNLELREFQRGGAVLLDQDANPVAFLGSQPDFWWFVHGELEEPEGPAIESFLDSITAFHAGLIDSQLPAVGPAGLPSLPVILKGRLGRIEILLACDGRELVAQFIRLAD